MGHLKLLIVLISSFKLHQRQERDPEVWDAAEQISSFSVIIIKGSKPRRWTLHSNSHYLKTANSTVSSSINPRIYLPGQTTQAVMQLEC